MTHHASSWSPRWQTACATTAQFVLLLSAADIAQGQTAGTAGKAPAISLESVRSVGLRDFQVMGEKFVALAEAFPESTYEWRPTAGVRSVREVFLVIIGENYGVLGAVLNAKPPAEFADGRPGMERLMALTSKEDIVRHLRASIATLRAGLESIAPDQMLNVAFFSPTAFRPLHAAIAGVAGDQHEHLGQLIAYARSNGVVPPWSRKEEK